MKYILEVKYTLVNFYSDVCRFWGLLSNKGANLGWDGFLHWVGFAVNLVVSAINGVDKHFTDPRNCLKSFWQKKLHLIIYVFYFVRSTNESRYSDNSISYNSAIQMSIKNIKRRLLIVVSEKRELPLENRFIILAVIFVKLK